MELAIWTVLLLVVAPALIFGVARFASRLFAGRDKAG
jgi:hypothetical protein